MTGIWSSSPFYRCINRLTACCCSVTKLCLTLCNPWTAAYQVFLSLLSPEVYSARVHWVSDAIHPEWYSSHPLSSPSPPSIFPSIRVFSNELAPHIWWPKYCSFSFSWIFRVNFLVFQLIDWCYEVYYLESDRARTWDPAAKTLEPPHL